VNGTDPAPRRVPARTWLFLLGLVAGAAGVRFAHGILIWVLLTAAAACGMFALGELALALPERMRPRTAAGVVGKIGLVVLPVLVLLTLFEVFLVVYDKVQTARLRQGEKDASPLTMPAEWARKSVPPTGTARKVMRWHGILHAYDDHFMRRSTPFPPKQEGTLRIMVVGDSMTYGEGVEESEAFPAVLEALLRSDYRVEVLSTGICGNQSQDAVRIAREFLPKLQPELVVYGCCLNDFLPSGVREIRVDERWPFPLPRRFKLFLAQRTLAGAFIDGAYGDVLMRLHLRADFFDEILDDSAGHHSRFARDVAELEQVVVQGGVPPIVTMVLNQFPVVGSREERITRAAEGYLRDAGMDVIGTEEYVRKYDGRRMAVSRWEGHPNAECHRIFAEMFAERLRRHPALERFRR
jgi:hypothetical protein